jgi:hypothetical protein
MLSAAEAPRPATSLAPKLKLLDPGTGKKKVYRYKFKANQKYKVEMDLSLSVEVKEGDQERPGQSLPIMRIGMTVHTGKVQPDGSVEARYEFTSSKVIANNPAEEQVAGAIAAELKAIQGLTGTGIVAPNGLMKDLKYSMKNNENERLPQIFENIQHTMEQVATTLPEIPIGIGAQWEMSSTVNADGISLQQTTRYTLVSVKGTLMKLKVKLTQHGDQQMIEKPGLPEGLLLTLDRFVGVGTGELTLNLSAPITESAFSTLKIETQMTAVHQGASQVIQTVLTTQSEIRHLKAETP